MWSLSVTLPEGVHQIKRLYPIPFPCYWDFFTKDYRLTFTVRPCVACTEDAIGCTDFEPKTCFTNAYPQHCSQLHKNYEEIPKTTFLIPLLARGIGG
ncbi:MULTISPECIES: hypothetical protein [unclassified Microcoleus]|uniref:hypothetical protein n=1 Tax=unclassified Microcoleus TaxID=2642155 RepID=UPI002FD217B6